MSVYPTWWAAQPAMLKGWIDRVWVRGVAWDLDSRRRATPRLRPGLRNVCLIVAVTTVPAGLSSTAANSLDTLFPFGRLFDRRRRSRG